MKNSAFINAKVQWRRSKKTFRGSTSNLLLCPLTQGIRFSILISYFPENCWQAHSKSFPSWPALTCSDLSVGGMSFLLFLCRCIWVSFDCLSAYHILARIASASTKIIDYFICKASHRSLVDNLREISASEVSNSFVYYIVFQILLWIWYYPPSFTLTNWLFIPIDFTTI